MKTSILTVLAGFCLTATAAAAQTPVETPRAMPMIRVGPLQVLPQARWHFSNAAITTTNEGRTVPDDQLFLSVDGRIIYEMRRFAIRLVELDD